MSLVKKLVTYIWDDFNCFWDLTCDYPLISIFVWMNYFIFLEYLKR
jgi:hypothetical protein